MKNTSVKKIPKKKSEIWIALLFSSLWIIGFLVFSLYPLIQSLLFSFNQVNVTPTEIVQTNVGFENFRAVLFDDPDFRNALRTYLIQMVVYVPIIIVVSLVIALLLNTIRKG